MFDDPREMTDAKRLNLILSKLAKNLQEARVIGSTELVSRSELTMDHRAFMDSVDKLAGNFHSLTISEIDIINLITKRL